MSIVKELQNRSVGIIRPGESATYFDKETNKTTTLYHSNYNQKTNVNMREALKNNNIQIVTIVKHNPIYPIKDHPFVSKAVVEAEKKEFPRGGFGQYLADDGQFYDWNIKDPSKHRAYYDSLPNNPVDPGPEKGKDNGSGAWIP